MSTEVRIRPRDKLLGVKNVFFSRAFHRTEMGRGARSRLWAGMTHDAVAAIAADQGPNLTRSEMVEARAAWPEGGRCPATDEDVAAGRSEGAPPQIFKVPPSAIRVAKSWTLEAPQRRRTR